MTGIELLLTATMAWGIVGDATHGTASWYSTESCQREGTSGTVTASGEAYDEDALTCASWDYPFGTMLLVLNRDNNKSVIVRVTDRGPSKRLVKRGRIIDLSKGAFSRIAELDQGVIRVTVWQVERGK